MSGLVRARTRGKYMSTQDLHQLSGTGEEASGHVPALERLAVRFESDHPALSAVARQVADALAKAGI